MLISFYTLGCKLNQAETDELKKSLIKKGFIVVPFDSGEDITIIRACGVTCNASRTTREVIRRAKRRGIYVIATGCLENKDLKEIDFAGKNNEEILCHCEERRRSDEAIPENKDRLTLSGSPRPFGARDNINRTRAFIKIQTGCNFKCAYCVIPSFRGKSQSVPREEVVEKINQAIKDGYKEAILTGVNICQYNEIRNTKDTKVRNDKYELANLLTEILKKTKIKRIRLGSLDPRLISDNLLSEYCHPERSEGSLSQRLLPHWHLSLQSGSDSVLKRMCRGYTAKQYLNIVNKLRQHNPLFSFTTDIIVGFPGETGEKFKETCEFVKKVGFAKVHIFPFSPRPGTPAHSPTFGEGPADNLKPITNRIVTERVKILTKIANDVAKKYAKQFIGLKRPVLFENKKGAYFYGYTPEYVRVRYESKKDLRNKIVDITTKNYF